MLFFGSGRVTAQVEQSGASHVLPFLDFGRPSQSLDSGRVPQIEQSRRRRPRLQMVTVPPGTLTLVQIMAPPTSARARGA